MNHDDHDNAKEDKQNWFLAQLFQTQPLLANCGLSVLTKGLDPKTLGITTTD